MVPRTNLFSGPACRSILHLSVCEYFSATSNQIQVWRASNGKTLCSKQARVQNLKRRRAYEQLEIASKHVTFIPDSLIINSKAMASSWSRVATAQALLVSFNLLCVSV